MTATLPARRCTIGLLVTAPLALLAAGCTAPGSGRIAAGQAPALTAPPPPADQRVLLVARALATRLDLMVATARADLGRPPGD